MVTQTETRKVTGKKNIPKQSRAVLAKLAKEVALAKEAAAELKKTLHYSPEFNIELLEHMRNQARPQSKAADQGKYTLDRALKLLNRYEAAVQVRAIDIASDFQRNSIAKVKEIKTQSKKMIQIYESLDLKTRIIIGLILELEPLSSVNVSTSFEKMILRTYNDTDRLISQAQKDSTLKDDSDIQFMSELLSLQLVQFLGSRPLSFSVFIYTFSLQCVIGRFNFLEAFEHR